MGWIAVLELKKKKKFPGWSTERQKDLKNCKEGRDIENAVIRYNIYLIRVSIDERKCGRKNTFFKKN